MGFREAVLFGIVLLFSGGNLCAAKQNWSNLSTNETLSQTPQERVATSLQLPRARQSNRTEQGDPVPFHVSNRLKIYQLRRPVKQKPLQPHVEQMQTFQNPQGSEASRLTSEQLERGETVQSQELLKLPHRGPDLNPPLKPESKVPCSLFDLGVPFL